MATHYTLERLCEIANEPLQSNGCYGKNRKSIFRIKTSASAPPGVGETIELGTLPAGARIYSIKVINESMGAAGENIDIGDVDDVDRFAAAYDVATAHSPTTAVNVLNWDTTPDTNNEPETGYLYKLTEETVLLATARTDPLAASKWLSIEVDYVID